MRNNGAQGHAGLLAVIVVMLSGLAGCVVDFPEVSPQGQVVGGDPKLNDLLHRVKAIRDENALAKAGVAEALYVVSVEPSFYTVSYEGTFPATGQAMAFRYDLLCSSFTLKRASVAVVTEFLVLRKERAVESCSYVLHWHDDRWDDVTVWRFESATTRPSSGPKKRGAHF